MYSSKQGIKDQLFLNAAFHCSMAFGVVVHILICSQDCICLVLAFNFIIFSWQVKTVLMVDTKCFYTHIVLGSIQPS